MSCSFRYLCLTVKHQRFVTSPLFSPTDELIIPPTKVLLLFQSLHLSTSPTYCNIYDDSTCEILWFYYWRYHSPKVELILFFSFLTLHSLASVGHSFNKVPPNDFFSFLFIPASLISSLPPTYRFPPERIVPLYLLFSRTYRYYPLLVWLVPLDDRPPGAVGLSPITEGVSLVSTK